MRRNADVVEILKNELGDPVVEHPFSVDYLVLLGVKRGGVVLEVLDERTRFGTLIEDLCLAFVNAAAAIHWD